MRKYKFLIVTLLFVLALGVFLSGFNSVQVDAKEIEDISAKSYIVIDQNGNTLIEKDKDKKREVASICKLMTTLITLEKIEDGSISLDDKFLTSRYASEMEGSQAFLDAGSEYTVRDLLKSVIVASANDSAVVLAENIAGNEKAFVKIMNVKCKEIGMNDTLYANSTGLPAIEQYSTAYDTSLLLNEISKYDLYREDCNIWIDELVHPSGRRTELVNTNRLIKYYDYCLTGKTGFTDEAGYCLSSTAMKDNLKLTCVVLGCKSSADRFTESMDLYNYAFANFDNELVVSAGDNVENNIKVLSGRNEEIKTEFSDNVYLLQDKFNKKSYKIQFDLVDSIKAPINIGDKVGVAMIIVNGEIADEVDVVSSMAIDKQTYSDIVEKIIDKFNIF